MTIKSDFVNTGSQCSKHDDFYSRLLEVVSHDFDQGRVGKNCHALMALIAEGCGSNCTSILLWLGDRVQTDRAQNVPEFRYDPELRLADVYDVDMADVRPDDLLNISVSWDTETFPALPEDIKQRISGWHKKIHSYEYKTTLALELFSATDDDSCLGYLQLLLTTDKIQSLTIPFDAIAKAMGARIFAGRKVRLMEATQSLQEKCWHETDPEQILNKAAIVIREYTRARMCAVYRPILGSTGRQLQVVAIDADKEAAKRLPTNFSCLSPASGTLTAHIFDRGDSVRIKNLGNPDEISKLFPSLKWEVDGELLSKFDHILDPSDPRVGTAHSRLYVPILFPAVGGGQAVVALIEVMGKYGDHYLHDQFSLAEEQILKGVARYLASILPGIEVMDSMSNICKALANAPLDEPGKQTHASIAGTLLGSLKKCVHGIEAVSFVFDNLSSVPAHTLPEDWARDLGGCLTAEVGKIVSIPGNKGRWCYATRPNGNPERTSGRLLVGLTTGSLPKYQADIINYTATEAWLTAYELDTYNHAIQYLIEVRHAIRSGVQGMIGHISSALDAYHLVEESDDPELTHRELVTSAAFRKSLEAGLLSAEHTQLLLEEARLQYAGIQHSSLRFGECNLPALLREMTRINRPEAEQRKLAIRYDDNIPSDLKRIIFDHQAMSIVLFNLLDNAIKYAARNTTIVIRTRVERQFWYAEIENEGVYIDPNDYERIFQSFVRISTHDPAARGGISTRPGTGLGLAISRKIITAHSKEANLTVKSNRLSGMTTRARTTFTIKMPRNPDKE